MTGQSPPGLDAHFMRLALEEARQGGEEGEVPIGCVIARDGKVLGRDHNRMETLRDPTAHAEILAIGAACQALQNWRLDGCTLYATLEPCPMCAGAVLNARISRLVFGARDKRLGAVGSAYEILRDNPIHRVVQVSGGIFEGECLGVVVDFFQRTRVQKKKPAGAPLQNPRVSSGGEEVF